MIGLYLTDLASPTNGKAPALSVSIRLTAACLGLPGPMHSGASRLDRNNRHIATVLAGIKPQACAPTRAERSDPAGRHFGHGRHPALRSARIAATGRSCCWALPGDLRRSEIVSLDVGKDDTPDSPAAGSRSSTTGLCSPSTLRPAGVRLRSAAARRTRPARCMPSSNGCTSPGSISGRSFVRTSRDGKRAF